MDKEMTAPAVSKKEMALNRLRAKYPDRQFEDEESIYDQINSDYDDYDNQLSELKKRESVFSELFTKDPRSAMYLMRWKDGEDPAIALISEFGDDIKAIIDDPERQKEVAAANKEYAERVAKEKAFEEEYRKNLKESLAYLDKLNEEGMSDDEIDQIMAKYMELVTDGVKGKFSAEGIEMIKKALNYDSAVKAAAEDGEIAGKNAKIDMKLRKANAADGVPAIGGQGGGETKPNMVRNMGAIEKFSSGDDIWKRGGEKRTKY